MARDLDVTRVAEDGCNVLAGTLNDPYTGRTITYSEAVNPSGVQIDHIYSLSRAWQHGAAGWTKAKRVRFANDPGNLLAVDGPTNASKGDRGPGTWVPANRAVACFYGKQYLKVARIYTLTMSRADMNSIRGLLQTCSGEVQPHMSTTRTGTSG